MRRVFGEEKVREVRLLISQLFYDWVGQGKSIRNNSTDGFRLTRFTSNIVLKANDLENFIPIADGTYYVLDDTFPVSQRWQPIVQSR